YRELTAMSVQVAGFVASLQDGAEPVPVALFSPNDYRVLGAMIGVMRAGGVIVPVHAASDLETAADFLNQVRARCVMYHSSLRRQLDRLRAEVPSIVRSVCLDGASENDVSFDRILSEPALPVPRWIDPSGNRTR